VDDASPWGTDGEESASGIDTILKMSALQPYDPHLGLVARAGWHPTAIAVCDCDFILDLAIAHVRDGASLSPVSGIGSIRCFAPMRVANEIVWNYGKASRRNQIDPALVLSVVHDELMPHIRFVDLSADGLSSDPRVKRVQEVDADDVDIARLAMLLAPCQVLSLDRHLRYANLAPVNQNARRELLAAGLSIESTDGAVVGSAFVAQIATDGISHGVRGVAVRANVPIWLVGLVCLVIMGAVGAWVLSSPERRAKVGRAIDAAGELADHLRTQRNEAIEIIARSSITPPASDQFERRIARCLAFAPGPMLAADIHAETFGSEGMGGPVLGEVRRILREEPAFVCVDRSRWELGKRLSIDAS
jgi:hypothetical protein